MNASVELPEQEMEKNRYPKEVSPTFRTPRSHKIYQVQESGGTI